MAILDIIIDDDLSWQPFANKPQEKLNGYLKAVRRIGDFMHTNFRSQVFSWIKLFLFFKIFIPLIYEFSHAANVTALTNTLNFAILLILMFLNY